MSATAPRLAQGTSDQRRLLVALGLVALSVAILVAVAFGMQAMRSSSASAAGGTHDLIVKGTNGGGVNYTGLPLPAPGVHKLLVSGTHGGGIEYTGIPYPVPAVGSSNSGVPYPIPGVRKAESGIPYPIPGVRKAESGIPYPIPGVRKAESTSTFSAGRGEGGVFKRINE